MKLKIKNIRCKTIITKTNIYLIGFISIKDSKQNRFDRNKINIKINDKNYKLRFFFKKDKID